ncbi:MAG TPA: hypothetical protein VMU83_00250 [Hanamia sp.]|nr:hypothetical protein [Hanamia sp.]
MNRTIIIIQYTTDTQLILNGLYRDRADLTKQLTDVERLIKKIKLGTFSLNGNDNNTNDTLEPVSNSNNKTKTKQIEFPLRGELRVQVINVMDMIGVACKLKQIQDKYKEMTGLNVNLRETVRTLSKHQILRILKPKGTERGLYWVKDEWLEGEGSKLKEQYKFEGFNLIWNDEDFRVFVIKYSK